MTKEIGFDLEFGSEPSVTPISQRGEAFCRGYMKTCYSMRDIYVLATSLGLHIRFANAGIRDSVTIV